MTKKANALVDTDFGRIVTQIAFGFDHAPINVKGTTDTPHTAQTPNFGAQERIGTLRFSIGSRLDGNGSTWTTAGATVRTIMITGM